MSEDGQIELFPDIEVIELPVFAPHTNCGKCEHILAVKFSNSNLFFCTIQKGGRYGKKIRKSDENCEKFIEDDEPLEAWDGRWGGYFHEPLKR